MSLVPIFTGPEDEPEEYEHFKATTKTLLKFKILF